MPDLDFAVEKAAAVAHAAVPLLALTLRLTQRTAPPVPIRNVLLQCQVRIEPARRRYQGDEAARLRDLFGQPDDWGRTLLTFLWTHANVNVPGFSTSTTVDLPVPCSYDFNVASTKYFDALSDGAIPLCLLFSGTIFYEGPTGMLQIAQIGWDREATFRLPVHVWRETIEAYFPSTAYLTLRKDVFDRLHQYKRDHGLPTWEQTVESLLSAQEVRS